ncbi:MAG: DUF1684 domain-containing protein [Bacteroidales bacterium]|nr:DUF1684 domain-containing protein [Bacteroidales bacterium]
MRKFVVLSGIILILVVFSCTKTDNKHFLEVKAWQDTLNMEFADAATSPLLPEDLAVFKGLQFYSIDKDFMVEAEFIRTPTETPFFMKTTTERQPVYVKYGIATFKIRDEACTLHIYQNVELTKKSEYADYLFIPFLDKTSGVTTYYGGRYIDLKKPKEDKMVIDFNKAYNPYCAYNDRYSCPIPPKENLLPLEITAGVRAFHTKPN